MTSKEDLYKKLKDLDELLEFKEIVFLSSKKLWIVIVLSFAFPTFASLYLRRFIPVFFIIVIQLGSEIIRINYPNNDFNINLFRALFGIGIAFFDSVIAILLARKKLKEIK